MDSGDHDRRSGQGRADNAVDVQAFHGVSMQAGHDVSITGSTVAGRDVDQSRHHTWRFGLGGWVVAGLLAIVLILVLSARGDDEPADALLPGSTTTTAHADSGTGGHRATRTVIHAQNPQEAILMIYKHVAEGSRSYACARFEPESVARDFARNFAAADCPTAVSMLHDKVTNASDYARPLIPSSMDLVPNAAGNVVVSSCLLDIRSGPRLGEFTLRVIPNSRGYQWIFVGHRAEDCP